MNNESLKYIFQLFKNVKPLDHWLYQTSSKLPLAQWQRFLIPVLEYHC